MTKIPSNVPVFIQDIESQANERYSIAKLKVFYQGETADHRLFTKEFSDKVIETLPSTPVVGFYSEEDEDFKGHNKIQYVYGHVPETASIEYVTDEDSGHTFVVTDVILYTEREDNIGAVAKKIVGKQHSLELDPSTLKYKINRDEYGRFLNIELLDGCFIGLSVLGDNESPAFTGSCFFTTNKDFKNFAAKCHNNFDKFLQFLDNSGGKIEVFNSVEFFSKTGEFLAKTMQEYQEEIYSALEAQNKYGWICENTTDYAVICQYNDISNKYEYIKYTISKDEAGKLLLSDPVEVKPRYLTDEEINMLDTDNNDFAKTKKNECESDCGENEKEIENNDNSCAKSCGDEDKKAKCTSDTEDNNDEDKGAADDTANPQTDEDDKDDKEDENKVGTATASVSTASLSCEEREELEQYRRAAKIAIIDSYIADLNEEILNTYRNKVDELSQSDIESKLAIEFRKIMKSKQTNDVTKEVTTFTTIITADSYNEDDPADAIKKYR